MFVSKKSIPIAALVDATLTSEMGELPLFLTVRETADSPLAEVAVTVALLRSSVDTGVAPAPAGNMRTSPSTSTMKVRFMKTS
jgi:hypothetical protein